MAEAGQIMQLAGAGGVGLSATLIALGLRRAGRAVRGASVAGDSMLRQHSRRRALAESTAFRLALPLVGLLVGPTRRWAPSSLRASVTRHYTAAGCPGGLSDDELAALAVLVSVGLSLAAGYVGAVLLGPAGLLPVAGTMALGPLLVSGSLESKAVVRRHRFNRSLPYVLDLLVLTLRAGTSLKLALARVVEDYAGHPIGDEFGQALAEIGLGLGRAEALRRLSERLDDDEPRQLVDSINQAEELGWPLADTIERLADRLTQTRLLSAQETAGAAGVKVMLPSTLVLMSAVLLLFGPTIVRALQGAYSMR